MKKLTAFLYVLVLVFGVVGIANSTLTTIGTASYDSDGDGTPELYNLIYEDDSINGGLVWLDYDKNSDTWQNQVDWASGLNTAGVLTYNLNPDVSVTWGGGWRLPITDESQCDLSGGYGYEGSDASGYHEYLYGYNMVNSEMGHLHFESLGNLANVATNGTAPQPGWGLSNTNGFNSLEPEPYWSGTEFVNNVDLKWCFHYYTGRQDRYDVVFGFEYKTIAVRAATVSDITISPAIPTVSEWGMIIFVILLVGSALWVIKRRTDQESA